MYDVEWDREYEPKTTNERLNEIETKLEIKISVGLREIWWAMYSSMPPQRDGDDASQVRISMQEMGCESGEKSTDFVQLVR